MELRHLRYFVAVAEEQNITRAASRLHVSQPPLSRQIRNLEDELGIALFDRDAKAVRLTEAGRVFLAEARIILQRTEEAMERAKDVARGKRGEIHVGYAPSLTVELLPRALKYFRKSNPGVRVQMVHRPHYCRISRSPAARARIGNDSQRPDESRRSRFKRLKSKRCRNLFKAFGQRIPIHLVKQCM